MNRRIFPLLFLVSCSCTIRSLHPAMPEGGSSADAAMLLGPWEVTEVINEGLPASPVVDVAAGVPGELILSMSSGTQTVSRRGYLANLDGVMVLSIQEDNGSWNIVKLEVDQDGQTMAVFGLDAEVLIQARDAGGLAAVQPGLAFGDEEMEIQEEQADLARFLREQPNAFGLQMASLRRVVDGTP